MEKPYREDQTRKRVKADLLRARPDLAQSALKIECTEMLTNYLASSTLVLTNLRDLVKFVSSHPDLINRSSVFRDVTLLP